MIEQALPRDRLVTIRPIFDGNGNVDPDVLDTNRPASEQYDQLTAALLARGFTDEQASAMALSYLVGHGADARTVRGYFVPNEQHDLALNAVRDEWFGPTEPDDGDGVPDDPVPDDPPPLGPPRWVDPPLVSVDERPTFVGDLAARIGGELGELFDDGKALAIRAAELAAQGLSLLDVPALQHFQGEIRDYLDARAAAGGLSEAEIVVLGALYAANEALMPTNLLDLIPGGGQALHAAVAAMRAGRRTEEVVAIIRRESAQLAEWLEREKEYVLPGGRWRRDPPGRQDAANQLAAALTRGGEAPAEGASSSPHHIVGFAVRDQDTQRILSRFGIAPNEAANGVRLPTSVHQGTYGNAYRDWVYERLSTATSATRARVILGEIKSTIERGETPWRIEG